ncbi:hypothetical protein ACVWU4_000953 [Campylobacter coli]
MLTIKNNVMDTVLDGLNNFGSFSEVTEEFKKELDKLNSNDLILSPEEGFNLINAVGELGLLIDKLLNCGLGSEDTLATEKNPYEILKQMISKGVKEGLYKEPISYKIFVSIGFSCVLSLALFNPEVMRNKDIMSLLAGDTDSILNEAVNALTNGETSNELVSMLSGVEGRCQEFINFVLVELATSLPFNVVIEFNKKFNISNNEETYKMLLEYLVLRVLTDYLTHPDNYRLEVLRNKIEPVKTQVMLYMLNRKIYNRGLFARKERGFSLVSWLIDELDKTEMSNENKAMLRKEGNILLKLINEEEVDTDDESKETTTTDVEGKEISTNESVAKELSVNEASTNKKSDSVDSNEHTISKEEKVDNTKEEKVDNSEEEKTETPKGPDDSYYDEPVFVDNKSQRIYKLDGKTLYNLPRYKNPDFMELYYAVDMDNVADTDEAIHAALEEMEKLYESAKDLANTTTTTFKTKVDKVVSESSSGSGGGGGNETSVGKTVAYTAGGLALAAGAIYLGMKVWDIYQSHKEIDSIETYGLGI